MYDLAIAKVALQLQEEENLKFNKVFLLLAAFILKWQHSQFFENTLPSLFLRCIELFQAMMHF